MTHKAHSTLSGAAQNGQCMTSKYRESDKRADGSYAFEWLSRYFDVIHRPFYAAPLKVERNLKWICQTKDTCKMCSVGGPPGMWLRTTQPQITLKLHSKTVIFNIMFFRLNNDVSYFLLLYLTSYVVK